MYGSHSEHAANESTRVCVLLPLFFFERHIFILESALQEIQTAQGFCWTCLGSKTDSMTPKTHLFSDKQEKFCLHSLVCGLKTLSYCGNVVDS